MYTWYKYVYIYIIFTVIVTVLFLLSLHICMYYDLIRKLLAAS